MAGSLLGLGPLDPPDVPDGGGAVMGDVGVTPDSARLRDDLRVVMTARSSRQGPQACAVTGKHMLPSSVSVIYVHSINPAADSSLVQIMEC